MPPSNLPRSLDQFELARPRKIRQLDGRIASLTCLAKLFGIAFATGMLCVTGGVVATFFAVNAVTCFGCTLGGCLLIIASGFALNTTLDTQDALQQEQARLREEHQALMQPGAAASAPPAPHADAPPGTPP